MNQRKSLQFLVVVLLGASVAFCISGMLPKAGGVWEAHLRAGSLLLSGSLPETPAYPMWGYSLLSGVFRENVILVSGVLLVVVLIHWYGSLFGRAPSVHQRRRLTRIVENPIVVAMMLQPFVFLSLSHFTSSMASLLAFWGAWMLYLAVETKRGVRHYAASGLLVGLGFNCRSEVLLLGILLFVAVLAFGLLRRCTGYYSRMAAVFLVRNTASGS